ncbi:hypothetical protein [Actinoallomurus sp. NPDC052274]|uniref:hypothetical protein n=1 Tax=Actinoallomurus sp. NPDC052274 TaxID=3155420 RepID=UPI00342EF95B
MDELRWWPVVGLGFGIALGFAGAFGGVSAFLIVLVLGVVGLLTGRALVGDLNLRELLGGRRHT